MLIKCFFKITWILFFAAITLSAQDKVVAKVGSYAITESEFNQRFNFSVHPGIMQKSSRLQVKKEFLKELIAEKLLSLEAKQNGYDTLEALSAIMTPLKNMFIRDALYSSEIRNKVSYNPDDLNEGVNRIKKSLKIKFIFSKDEAEINSIYSLLGTGASFDSLLSLRRESADQSEPREITFGTMDKAIEDNLFDLKEGEYTTPVASEDGFYILKLIGISTNYNLKDQANILEDVKRIVETRKTHKRYIEYYRNFFSNNRVAADKDIFEKLSAFFYAGIRQKYMLAKNDQPSKLFLRGEEVTSALKQFSKTDIERDFIKIKEKPVSVKYFLNQLGGEGFYVGDTTELRVRSSLSSYIRKFIEDELLASEGIKQGLQNNADVKKYVNMWEDSYLSKMLMLDLFDSVKVSEDEAFKFYTQQDGKNLQPDMVNIVEVLTDSLPVIEKVLNELSKGKNLKELARLYSQRDSFKEGESGLMPATKLNEIGNITAQMNIGDIYGPVKLDEGYSVFQLIDRRKDTTDYSQNFDDVKDQIISRLTLERFEDFVNSYNARLAGKYGVEIHEDVLESAQNIFLNLVVIRYMGFGGEIFAVPYTQQYTGWYDEWMNNKKLNP